MRSIGIFGGAFDPVHNGHISVAQQAKERLAINEIRFIPLRILPHHKQAIATAEQRLAMLELATKDQAGFVVDRRELESDMLSYTLFTLQSMRTEFPQTALILLMGDDAFANINTWKDWQRLLDYVHIVFVRRTANIPPAIISHWMKQYLIDDAAQLHCLSHGYIYSLGIRPIKISSSQIIKHIANNLSVEGLLPETVRYYIQQTHLYSF